MHILYLGKALPKSLYTRTNKYYMSEDAICYWSTLSYNHMKEYMAMHVDNDVGYVNPFPQNFFVCINVFLELYLFMEQSASVFIPV